MEAVAAASETNCTYRLRRGSDDVHEPFIFIHDKKHRDVRQTQRMKLNGHLH